MLSAFKYRLYPKDEQEMRLKRSLLSLCSLYDGLRARKIEEYRQRGISLTRTDLRATALEQRKRSAELQLIHSQVVQNVADRLHSAFVNFFEGRGRFPKNKRPRKYLSFTYPQSGFKINPQRGLYLSGVGYIRMFVHRPCLGRLKRLTIKYEAGEWYAIFITERETPVKQGIEEIPNQRVRAADLGLEKFAALDNAESIEYPEYLRRSEEKIKALQRRLAHKKKGSKRWRQTCFSLARVHLHVKRQREDFQNKLVSKLFRENDALVLEKLNIQGILGNHSLAKSISDVSWGKFARKAVFKAEILGKHTIFVDPWGTTQFCYNCLTWVPKGLEDREHVCPNCGVKISRDLNSALLIKRLGILYARCPPSDGGLSPAEPRPLPSLRGMASQGVEAGSLGLQS
ncbi:MAG: transposase [Thaumarchaeota archaeon]|nr:transposase [Nitrososphaerota archaeon]